VSYTDNYLDPEARRQWYRKYMREWRKKNPDKCKTYKQRQAHKNVEYCLAYRCKGDGWEVDTTDFVPESPKQSAMWAKLLSEARP
jgi:hypothetical protein